MKNQLFFGFIGFMLIFIANTTYLSAQTQTPICHANNPASKTTQGNRFKINFSQIDDLAGGITDLEWKYNILNAAEQWNNFANGGWLEYDGETTITTLPTGACTTAQKINLVNISTNTAEYSQTITAFHQKNTIVRNGKLQSVHRMAMEH